LHQVEWLKNTAKTSNWPNMKPTKAKLEKSARESNSACRRRVIADFPHSLSAKQTFNSPVRVALQQTIKSPHLGH
jgi:hypothetical protein